MSAEHACTVDLDSGDVQRGERIERLPPRLLALLRYLIAHPQQVVSRDEMITSVWGHLEAASDDSVNVAVSDLRKALGDTRRPHRIIETVPRRGYRYLGIGIKLADLSQHLAAARPSAPPATAIPPAAGSPTDTPAAPPGRRPQATGHFAGLGLAAALVGLISAALLLREPAQGTLTPSGPSPAQPPSPATAVAVLPFAHPGNDPSGRQLADALVDRIIHMLAQVRGLQVVARTSSFAFRDSRATVAEIGEALQVGSVLEGSVLQQGNSLRVMAQLINARDGRTLWSASFDREADALFVIQDEIAGAVSRTLAETLLPERALEHPVSRAAYDLSARARLAIDEDTVASTEAAWAFYEQALEHDPDYLPALVGLFEVGGLIHGHRGGDPGPLLQQALGALDRAQTLAPNDPEVLRATGFNLRRLGNLDAAAAHFARALDANPNDAQAWSLQGDLQLLQGHYDAALDSLRRAQRIDPLSRRIGRRLADAYWAVGRSEEALARLRDILRRDPGHPSAYGPMATYLAQLGRSGEAMRYISALHELDPDSPTRWAWLCEFHLQLGDDVSAERCTDQLEAAHDHRFRILYLRQAILAFRGEWQARHALMDALLESANRNDPLIPGLVAESHARFDCTQALDLLGERMPTLFLASPSLAPPQLDAARVAIRCLQEADQFEQAENLLVGYERVIERLRLRQGPYLVTGMEDAWARALRGDHDGALESLVRLVDSGWRYYWWQLDAYPEFAQIRNRPAFRALQARLEAGVAAQRAHYEAQRGEPLF